MADQPRLVDHIGSIKKEAGIAMRMMPGSARGRIELDDLVQEGFVVFLRAMDKFDPDLDVSFNTVLVSYLKNKYANLVRDAYTQKRFAVMVAAPDGTDPMEDAFMPRKLVNWTTPEDFMSAAELASLVRGSLSDAARSVFDTLLNPPEGLTRLAVATMFRKRRSRRAGHRVRGFDSVRITRRHLAIYLGMSKPEVKVALREIEGGFKTLGVAIP